MADIISLGEMLVDFTFCSNENNEIYYKQNPGGASANVAVMAAKLGASSGFIGKLGKDMFGRYLKDTLDKEGVDTKGVVLDENYSTTLAFVRRDDDGSRDYVFYHNSTPEHNLSYSEINLKLIDKCRLLHFGSLMLAWEPSKSAAINTVEYAKQQGKIITYDPNWREQLWESREEAIKTLPAIAKLLNSGIKIICITQGAKDCIIATKQGIEQFPTFKVETVDTLGSGDSFFGAFISRLVLSGKGLDEIYMTDLRDFAVYANACGALSSTKIGAIPAMPTHEEVLALIEKGPIY